MLSKPEALGISGISLRGVWLLRGRQPVDRRHDVGAGCAMEQANRSFEVKGKRRVANPTRANSEAPGRGGVACSRAEAPVMGVARRSHGVLEMNAITLRKEGRSR